MNSFLHLIPPSHVSALGWTLLHSLWQGTLLGLLAAFGFYVLRHRPAQSRYLTGVSLLGVQLVAAVGTYMYYLPSSAEVPLSAASESLTSITTFTGYGLATPLPLLLRVQLWLAAHMGEIVVCWLVGVGLLLLRFIGGWTYLERLRHASRLVSDRTLHTRFGVLVARLDIRQSVEFRETARILTPMVVGVLRPVVLVPLGLLNGLSPAEAEAILAHELAHIRRHDYLVNLLQSLVEVIFFFHPVLWWLSNRIRAEREHCCDDLAMAVCDNRLSLAHALVRVAEFRQESRLVVAFASDRPLLLQRINRVLGVGEQPGKRVVGYFPMAIVLLSLLVGASVYAYQKQDSLEKTTRKVKKASLAASPPSSNDIPIPPTLPADTLIAVEVEPVVGVTVASVVESVEAQIAVVMDNRMNMVFINDTTQKKRAEYQEKMRSLQLQMKPHHEEIRALQMQMEPLHRKMADLQLDIEKQQFEIERVQREQEKIEWKKQQLLEARQQLIEKRSATMNGKAGQAKLSEADQEKQMSTFESQIKAREQEINSLNEQIAQNRKKMQEVEKPINDLTSEMEKVSQEMEVYSQKMEAISEKMEVIGGKMEQEARSMEEYMPAPPRSPKAPGATKIKGQVAPPHPPKAPGATSLKGKVAPASPKAPPTPPAPPKKKSDSK